MTDRFASHSPGLESPYSEAVAVTPNDAVDLPFVTRALYIGVPGSQGSRLTVTMQDGSIVTFSNVLNDGISAFLPLRVRRVHATETSVTNIIALA